MSDNSISRSAARKGISERSPLSSSSAHPLPIGGTVTVISIKSGFPFIEGSAVISGIAPGNHRYLLNFPGDKQMHDRFVHPASQADPIGTLCWLLELWRASIQPPLFEEFFPDDIDDGA